MPQSLTNILVHVTFSTKDRRPVLVPELQPEIFAYMATVLKNDGCPTLIVGGHLDHIHILFRLSRTKDVATLVRDVKTSSSAWLKPKAASLSDFAWQAGYAGFSVSARESGGVKRYMESQEEHHKKWSFQDELRTLLRENETEYDERYVWD